MTKHTRSDDRLELLLFELGGRQRFGINVLKVKEIIPCPSSLSDLGLIYCAGGRTVQISPIFPYMEPPCASKS